MGRMPCCGAPLAPTKSPLYLPGGSWSHCQQPPQPQPWALSQALPSEVQLVRHVAQGPAPSGMLPARYLYWRSQGASAWTESSSAKPARTWSSPR